MKKGVTTHPGGSMICQGEGTDSSEIFRVIHPEYVKESLLPKFCIGKILNQPSN